MVRKDAYRGDGVLAIAADDGTLKNDNVRERARDRPTYNNRL